MEEKHLAVALGYPMGWRVKRAVAKSGKMLDVIYAGNPKKGVDGWFHHEAARAAAVSWYDPNKKPRPNPFSAKGGHFLPLQPKYQKGDTVEVIYKKEWYKATVLKRRESMGQFLYTVHYVEDDSTQADIEEKQMRKVDIPIDQPAYDLATNLGFPEGWKATQHGKSRYTIKSPSGETFRSKRAAMQFVEQHAGPVAPAADLEDGDPPWRRTGHALIGRKLRYTSKHALSGKRTVDIVQVGSVAGWISETDLDSAGEPAYICEAKDQPADLFHVVFEDQPRHQYAKYLLDSIDMELEEIVENVIDEETVAKPPPRKRTRKR
eukprot:CAMPEP_0194027272 /NCGR_PEP_ID=MMETSP0009_2-20130614/1446_1 /TAXON_ID=210454 /ORGANISM="Grammatophora oceanica, Strain CCMP 410" /LENGTH=319 /DNA_ID=CAMNT_0038666277 /DNA_START=105 /DNA_END=1064 /DNA_ORIENTATION=-